jgi:inosine-uridine nucleoside N-ribohydrolase
MKTTMHYSRGLAFAKNSLITMALAFVWVCVLVGFIQTPVAMAAETKTQSKIPVIFDTDIGDDIDDTWALAMLLNSPELDVKLVVGDKGKSIYRAKLIAKMLEVAQRSDISVGIGLKGKNAGSGPQSAWVKDYRLEQYPGKVHQDGVQAIIDTIMQSPKPITLIAVGPLPNVAAALEREPRIAKRAKFVGMHGSVRLGYGGNSKVSAEYNVRADVKACQKVLSAAWDITITPLDTCGLVHLTGKKYSKVRDSRSPLARAVIKNYRFWSAARTKAGQRDPAETRSSTLFDTVAVYLAYADSLLTMEDLGIRVDDKGYTVIDEQAKKMRVATKWIDMGAFEDLLLSRIIAGKE